MGTPTFSVPILKALAEKYEVKLVISQPDHLDKKRRIVMTPIHSEAINLNIECMQPEHIKDIEDILLNIDADILVTAAYGQFIPTKILSHFKKCINVHGSILPKRRGGAPIQRSIIEGDKETGVTIMEMVKKMDAGRIYAIKKLPILDSDNNTSLFEKLSILGRDLLMESIEDIYNEKNLGYLQNEEEATVSLNISPSEELIDFNKDSRIVFNQIRGLSHEPGAYFIFNGQRIKVYKASLGETQSKPGTIVSLKKKFEIACLNSSILIEQIKIEGKKEMDVKSFLNGQKLFKEGDVINEE
jgi:methionyl-tRNA formyltransferase